MSRLCNAFLILNVVPFFGKVIRGVIGFKVDPFPGRQVQPVQVCAVDVTSCTSKHIQEAIDDDHRL